jgi:hypothetical protein
MPLLAGGFPPFEISAGAVGVQPNPDASGDDAPTTTAGRSLWTRSSATANSNIFGTKSGACAILQNNNSALDLIHTG